MKYSVDGSVTTDCPQGNRENRSLSYIMYKNPKWFKDMNIKSLKICQNF